MALRAVIFDYGMVLSAPADPVAHAHLIEIFGAPAEVFEQQYWAHRHAYDEGNLDGPAFWRACADKAGVSLEAGTIELLIATDIRMWTRLNQPMVDWALAVTDAGFRTGILSNIGFELVPPLLAMPWVGRLHHNTWSCHERIAKPEPAIYHHAVDRLGVRPEEALFLDDKQENILSAQAVGLQGLIFRHAGKLRHDLAAIGLDRVLPPVPADAE